MQKTLTVESETQREGQKTRSFSVQLMALVLANELWEQGTTAKERTSRPVFLAYVGTDQASRAFSANLRAGRAATLSSTNSRIEIPKSAGFRYETFSRNSATLTLAYLSSLFSLQPSAPDEQGIAFVCLPPTWWVDEQAAAIAPLMGAAAREAATAAYFVAYLDQRSTRPIANDLAFHLSLYRAALQQDGCQTTSEDDTNRSSFVCSGLDALGFEAPLCCNVDHQTFETFLTAQTSAHLPRMKELTQHGTTRIDRPGRILPNTGRPAAQPGLFG